MSDACRGAVAQPVVRRLKGSLVGAAQLTWVRIPAAALGGWIKIAVPPGGAYGSNIGM